MTTVRMVRDADGKTADVDPREVGNMHGWRVVTVAAVGEAGPEIIVPLNRSDDGTLIVPKALPDFPTIADQSQAVHRGRGSYSVMYGETEILERLTKAEAEEFNALDADGRVAFVNERVS